MFACLFVFVFVFVFLFLFWLLPNGRGRYHVDDEDEVADVVAACHAAFCTVSLRATPTAASCVMASRDLHRHKKVVVVEGVRG